MQPLCTTRVSLAFKGEDHDNCTPLRLGLSGIVGYNFPAPVAVLNLHNVCWPYTVDPSPQYGILLACIEGCQPNVLLCSNAIGTSFNYTWAVPLHLESATGVWTYFAQSLDDNRLFIPREQLQHNLSITFKFVDPLTGLMQPLPPSTAGSAAVLEISVQPAKF